MQSKPRISDDSHSQGALHGVGITKVETLNDGDLLMVKDGKWVPTGQEDGYTGLTKALDRGTSVESLSDVSIDGIEEGQVLGYNGKNWVNIADQKLTEADVGDRIRRKVF